MRSVRSRHRWRAARRRHAPPSRALFDIIPIAMMEDDNSLLKREVDRLRASGVTDVGAYLRAQPQEAVRLVRGIRHVDVNRACVDMHQVRDREEFFALFERVATGFALPYFIETIELLSAGHGAHDGEAKVVMPDGQEHWMYFGLRIVPGHEATWGRCLVSIVDITVRKRLEQQLLRLDEQLDRRLSELEAANRELETFSYSVSHDLRAPLRAVASLLALLERRTALDAEGAGLARRALARCEEMNHLIDSLLALARLGRRALVPQDVDLSGLARVSGERLRAEEPGRRATIRIEPAVHAWGDPALLAAVVDNLIGNAWKFTRQAPETEISFGFRASAGKKSFFVRDNGIGFDMSDALEIFQPFRRLRAASEFPGAGIGLAMVSRIIERHGGRVWAESEPGRGATFWFTLADGPRAPQSAAGAAETGAATRRTAPATVRTLRRRRSAQP